MTGRVWMEVVLLSAALGYGAACGSKPPAPPAQTAHATPERSQPAAEAPVDDAPPPSHDPFEQPEDTPVDTKAVLQEMRHDCCTELPAAEIEQHRSRE